MCHLEGIIDQKQCLRRLHSYSFCFWLGAVDFCLRGWSSSMMYFECYSRKLKSFGSICIFSFPWVEENDERNLKLWITQTRTICMTVLLCFCWDLMLIIIFRTLQITIGSWVVGEFLLSPRAGQMKHIGKSTHLVSVQWKHFSNSLLGSAWVNAFSLITNLTRSYPFLKSQPAFSNVEPNHALIIWFVTTPHPINNQQQYNWTFFLKKKNKPPF